MAACDGGEYRGHDQQRQESRGVRSGAVGIDLGAASGISPGELDVLRRELSGFDVRDVSKMFWRLRMIKTPAEIACMRRAGRNRVLLSAIRKLLLSSALA